MISEQRERPEGCITDLTFDAWFADELDVEAQAAAAAHIADCARCRERRALLAGERERFLALRPHASPKWPPHRGARQRLRWAAPAALVFAAAAVLVLVGPGTEPPADGGVRRKGGADIGFFVQRAGVADRGVTGQEVHPGDLVRFVYTSEQPAYLAIYARDAHGGVSVYFPAGAAASRVPSGHDVELDSSVELDHVLGRETVYALFCAGAFPVAAQRQLLSSRGTLQPPPGCRVDTLHWNRTPVP